jgi:hypothetical protein
MTELHFPTEEELDALVDETPVLNAAAVKRRTLSRIQKGVEPGSMKKKSIIHGLLIAAVICALSVSTLAVANYAMDGRIASFLGIGEAQAEALSNAGQSLNLTSEDNGTKMTVLQTLGDSNTLYIMTRFDFPDTVTVSDQVYPEDLKIYFEGSGGYTWDVLEQTEHSQTYLFQVGVDNNLNGQEITLTAENFARYLPEEECTDDCYAETIVTGTWSQTWKLDYVDNSQTWKLNQPMTLEAQDWTLKSVCASPLSITMHFTGPEEPESAPYSDNAPILHYADGTEVTPEISTGGSSCGCGEMTLQFQFRQVMEMEGLTAMTLEGIEIPLT